MPMQQDRKRAAADTHVLVLEPDSEHELNVYGRALRNACPGINVHLASNLEAATAVQVADVVVAKAIYLTQGLVDSLPKLAWVHSLISGEDHIRRLSYPTRPVITATRGVHSVQVSELTILMMMALLRDLPRFLAAQAAQEWQHRAQPTLSGKVAVIVGLGRIAEELARLLTAFGMIVDGVSNGRNDLSTIRKVYPRDRLREAVSDADFVIALLPLSPETTGIFGRDVFAAMKPSAFFINVARGGVADEEALVDALRSGRLAGAGVDVFSVEPLPPGHPLWRAPNVILTPHVAGRSDVYAEAACPLLIEGMRNFLEGRTEDMAFQVKI
jgi:D-2-hydroxyacid dehydrogenase (NADP+)